MGGLVLAHSLRKHSLAGNDLMVAAGHTVSTVGEHRDGAGTLILSPFSLFIQSGLQS